MTFITVKGSPRTSLTVLFLAWKVILLTIALVSPGPGYDTSTQLLFKGHGIQDVELPLREVYSDSPSHAPTPGLPFLVGRLLQALTRWDAIFFVSVAERGYNFEQEWAFGWGFLRAYLPFATKIIPFTSSTFYNVVLHGIAAANLSHLISVLVLYQLVLALPLRSTSGKSSLAFIAAALHVVAPAGIFLVAPYTEAPFSLLNFAGQLFYIYSWANAKSRAHSLAQDLYLVLCGVCFGLAATVRGNGLLSGLILLFDAVLWFALQVEARLGVHILNVGSLPLAVQAELRSFRSRRLPATIIAGLFVAVGFTTPQLIAYREFCAAGDGQTRPWCHRIPPSIYSWVQSHYWNVGFLRYWTLSNLPLFLIAAPMLYTLIDSARIVLNGQMTEGTARINIKQKPSKSGAVPHSNVLTDAILVRLAIPQLALACGALSSFHVQVITRLSSGYPLWYVVLARDVMDDKRTAQWTVRWMVMYALIQAVLFVNFLPPA